MRAAHILVLLVLVGLLSGCGSTRSAGDPIPTVSGASHPAPATQAKPPTQQRLSEEECRAQMVELLKWYFSKTSYKYSDDEYAEAVGWALYAMRAESPTNNDKFRKGVNVLADLARADGKKHTQLSAFWVDAQTDPANREVIQKYWTIANEYMKTQDAEAISKAANELARSNPDFSDNTANVAMCVLNGAFFNAVAPKGQERDAMNKVADYMNSFSKSVN